MDSEALLRQGRFREALDRARSRGDLRGAVLAALSLGENALAEGLLSAWKSAGLEAEAERLALLGFLEARKGRLERYRELALEGAKRAQTPLTLYHLGLALPPKQGLVALEEAFKGVQGDPEAEGRIALALARVLRRLGRFREALACAALAELRRPEPFRTLERLWLSLLAEETPSLAELAREAEPLLLHEGRGVWLYATWLLAQLRFLEGDLRGAARLLESLLSLTPWQGLPFFAPMGVRLLREAGQVEAAHRLLQAARVAEGLSPLHRGLVRLAEGLLQFPEGGREALQEAFSLLSEEVAEEALLACFHLQRLGLAPQSPTPWPQTLSARGLRLLGGEWLSCAVPIPYLEVLGGGRLAGLYPLRPRGLELLVLLLSRPEGWEGAELAQALYGSDNRPALKMELGRLREAGLTLASRPYRLLTPLRADFLEVQGLIREGSLREALRLYKGPLLPQSGAPGVEELRQSLEEQIKEAVLATGDTDLIYLLAERLPEDLEVWEALQARLPPHNPRYPATAARLRRLRREYGV